jgi:hypothetical protein
LGRGLLESMEGLKTDDVSQFSRFRFEPVSYGIFTRVVNVVYTERDALTEHINSHDISHLVINLCIYIVYETLGKLCSI